MAKEITFIIPEDAVEHERLHEEFWKRERQRKAPRSLWNVPGEQGNIEALKKVTK